MLAYALGVAGRTLTHFLGPGHLERILNSPGNPFLIAPALFWTAALIHLLPETSQIRDRLDRWWTWGILPLSLLAYAAAFILGWPDGGFAGFSTLLTAIVLVPLIGVFCVLVIDSLDEGTQGPRTLLFAASILFALGTGLSLVQFEIFPRRFVEYAIGADLVLLGYAVIHLDAFEQGEAVWSDFRRALSSSILTVGLFGGLVAITIAFGTGATLPMQALLLATISAAILIQTFPEWIQTALDRLAFPGASALQQERATLRATANALPRVNKTLDIGLISDDELIRLTRRALSHYGNLPKLAASPLTQLRVIERRVLNRGASANTLERAAELKSLLKEATGHLKPPGEQEFGTSDEWRYHNALYFPYILGIRPYSRRINHQEFDRHVQAALEWFQTQVPERTLYNWQNAGARLIAQYILELEQSS